MNTQLSIQPTTTNNQQSTARLSSPKSANQQRPGDRQRIRIGLIGAGLFVRDVHLPSLQRLADRYEIVAICSRGGESARKLAQSLPGEVAVYSDPSELLAHPALDLADIATPILTMPGLIEQALRAGKHVISEKPIAPDRETARHLLAVYQETVTKHPGQQWMVGENWRYESAFVEAAKLVHSGAIGRPLTCHWALHSPMTAANKYFHTAWRRAGDVPGGWVLDVAVHHIASLRMILGELASVRAVTEQFSPDLPPMDTMAATLRFQNGVVGTYLFSHAAASFQPPILTIVGEQGCLRVNRGFLELTRGKETTNIPVPGMNGVEEEFKALADTLQQQIPHRNTPQEALQDLVGVDALLHAAATDRVVSVAAHEFKG